MGVDCRVILPGNVSVRNVANVMGALAGCRKIQKEHWVDIDGVSVEPCSIATLAEISITPPTPMVDGRKNHLVSYHFEPSGENSGCRLMMPRSTAFWIALMRKVVDFFGGRIDYQDCDASDVDYEVPFKTWQENSPDDGEIWDDFQRRLAAIVPVTEEEWRAADRFAAYKIDG